MSDLLTKIFGESIDTPDDMVERIKNNCDQTELTSSSRTGAYVVPAPKINQIAGNTTDGLVVKLGNKEWMPVSLTIATLDGKEVPVLTLYLANDDGTMQFQPSNTSNVYSSSHLRKHVLTDTKWALFQDSGADSFAQKYLIQPNNIAYQQNETMIGRAAPSRACPNDALGVATEYYKLTDTFNDPDGNQVSYTAWGKDYIWVPSLAEAGPTSAIWQLTDKQRGNSSSSWLRSGGILSYPTNSVYKLPSNGGMNYYQVNTTGGIRPAIHLNLSVAAHFHSWGEWTITKAATCKSKGEKEHICSVCGETETEDIPVDVNAHSYATEFTEDTPATCTTAGSKSKHCANCGDKIEVTPIPALGHDWGEWITVTAATCTSNGTRKHVCARDGTHVETETVTAAGHKYSDVIIAATCTDDGYTTHTCSVCGDEYTDNPVNAAGHSYGTPVWKWAAKFLTASAKFTCSVCNNEKTINASVTHESETASCTVAGDTTHTATVNLDGTPYSDVKVAKGEKLPHDSELISTTVEPTCTEEGAGQFKCKNCSEEYTDIIPALGHTEEIDEGIEATCTTAGKTEGKHCSVCNTILTEQTEISALGHDFSDEPIWTWADDYFTVTATFVCTRGDNFTIDVPADVDEERTTATCTVAGDAVFIATVTFNDDIFTDTQTVLGTTIPHKYEIVSWEWNGLEGATATYKCSVCGDGGEASGEAVAERVEPTCNTEGKITYTVTVEYPYLQKATDTKTETFPATGIHEYEFASWSWGEDYSASANLQCKTCGNHSEQKVEVTFVDDEENRTFSATVEINGETYTDSKMVPLGSLPDDIKNPDGNLGGGFDIMSIWWIFVIIGAVLLIIILVVVIVVVKKRKAAAAGYDDYYDDDYDYDDGENYGDDGDYNCEDYDYDGEEYDDGGGDEEIIIEDDE